MSDRIGDGVSFMCRPGSGVFVRGVRWGNISVGGMRTGVGLRPDGDLTEVFYCVKFKKEDKNDVPPL